MRQQEITLPEDLPWPEDTILMKIRNAMITFDTITGKQPTKIFLSVDIAMQLIIEVLPNAIMVKQSAGKNRIMGMEIYRVIEPGIIACSL